jgi:hypothetical protein
VIPISPRTHYELYHDWRKALAVCRGVADAAPPEPMTFHMFWRQSRGAFWLKRRPFARKQALPVKSFFATQDLSRCRLILWSDEDLSGNPWLTPFDGALTHRVYSVEDEARGTPLEALPDLYRQQDRKVWRDGDLFRILVLHNYGGVYVDMDMVLLRNLGALLGKEFVYQWDDLDGVYNGAIMYARKDSALTRELIAGVMELPAGEFNWGQKNLGRAIERGADVAVYPSPFFDTEWTANPSFRPFQQTPESADLYDGAFAWHWHNRWDEPIEPGSKFQRLEAIADAALLERGFAVKPVGAR